MYSNRRIVVRSTERYLIDDTTPTVASCDWQTADVFPWPSNNAPSLPHRYTNNPRQHLFIVPRDLFKGVESRRARSLRMGYNAIRAAKVAYPEPLPERLYHRPKRKGRACGSRYRVMLP